MARKQENQENREGESALISCTPKRLGYDVGRKCGQRVVPGAGLEPARPFGQGILSPLRLPFRHPGFCLRNLRFSQCYQWFCENQMYQTLPLLSFVF